MAENYKFKTKPWKHQLDALDYLYHRDTAALYTDMGSGKTKIMIDLIVNRGFRNTIVVCTNKGCSVWMKQFNIHADCSDLQVINLSGLPTPRKLSLINSTANRTSSVGERASQNIWIINYEGIWRKDLANYLMKKSFPIDCVICDESHRIKSPSSKCSMFLKRLGGKVKCKYLVTGTPLAENPIDVYAQYRFLDPSIFGTNFNVFKSRYQNVDIQATMSAGFTVLDKKEPYINLDELHEKMFSCAFYAKPDIDLPKQRNIIWDFDLPPKVRKLYKQLSKDKVLQFPQGLLEVDNALAMVTRKLQLVSGFVKVIELRSNIPHLLKVDETRAEQLKEILEGLPPEEPVVVFAKYTHDLRMIKRVCESIHRGYSEVSGQQDSEQIWQKGDTSVLGVQYTSGSESLDFTRARYCIYYGLTHSLALYLQSKKRIHRPGQTRSCVYYHIVANDTIDVQIIEALKQKKDIVEYVMNQEDIL